MRQVEVSKTLVFDVARRARSFFEALVTDNIDIGRPERVSVVFGLDRRGAKRKTPHQTRIFTPGTDVHIVFRFKHSQVKQYLKGEGQRAGALRFGDPRALALTGAMCFVLHAVTGFTNKSLRGLVAGIEGWSPESTATTTPPAR